MVWCLIGETLREMGHRLFKSILPGESAINITLGAKGFLDRKVENNFQHSSNSIDFVNKSFGLIHSKAFHRNPAKLMTTPWDQFLERPNNLTGR